MIYDIIIVGLGPAGIGAAIYAQRSGLNVLCLEKNMPGGYINYIDTIENYIGEASITGPELAMKLFKQIKHNNIQFKIQNVTDIKDEDDIKVVVTDKEEFKTHHVIVATGHRPKRLNIENEAKLLGRGVSTCALCDGPLYKDKTVAVIGCGNSALSEAIYLSKICKKIYLIHRRDTFSADAVFVDKVSKVANIEIVFKSKVVAIVEQDDKVKSIKLDTDQELNVDGIFIYIGFSPATNFLSKLDVLDETGYIVVDHNQESRVKGIYGAGDAIKKESYQIIPAVNDGIMAAIHISKK